MKNPWSRDGAHSLRRNSFPGSGRELSVEKGVGMKNKLEVGQTVYLHKKIGPQPTKVIKVGKKYFQVDAARIQFFIDTLQSNSQYGSPDQIYLSKQELLDEIETEKLRSQLFGQGAYLSPRLNLDQLRRITSIINEP